MFRCTFFLPFLIAFILTGCESKLEPVNAKRMINNVTIEKAELCDNELALISSTANNWKVDVDTIQNIAHFKALQKQAVSAYFISEEGLANTDDRHPKLFPYITVNDVDVSMMRFLMPVRGGYRMAPEDLKWIKYSSEEKYENSRCEKRVFEFYNAFVPKESTAEDDPLALAGPVVNITVADNDFAKTALVLEDIAEGYIVAMSAESIARFNKELCELDQRQLGKLQKEKPFQVRLFKEKNKRP